MLIRGVLPIASRIVFTKVRLAAIDYIENDLSPKSAINQLIYENLTFRQLLKFGLKQLP